MRVLIAVLAALVVLAALAPRAAVSRVRCSVVASPNGFVGVIRDTTRRPLPGDPLRAPTLRMLPPGSTDTLWKPGTPMPTAVVDIALMDPATRAQLAAEGISATTPRVIVQAVPYQADCRTIAWTDSTPWVLPGATPQYFFSVRLRPRADWIDETPTFTLAGGWNAPYPRAITRVSVFVRSWDPASDGLRPPLTRDSLVGAADLFAYDEATRGAHDAATHLRWAAAHPDVARREPIRSSIKDLALREDHARAAQRTSAYAGSYRVEFSSGDQRASWVFRTVARPSQQHAAWNRALPFAPGHDSLRIPGYMLAGFSPDGSGQLPATRPTGPALAALRPRHWLAVRDPITTPTTAPPDMVQAELLMALGAAPESVWAALLPFAAPTDPHGLPMPSSQPTPLAETRLWFPLTLRRAPDGSLAADTTLQRDGRTARVRLVRVDDTALH